MIDFTHGDFVEWIDRHINDDPIKLRLKYAGTNDGFDYEGAITQIECRRRFGKKLSETLSRYPDFIFPSILSGEQSTSDRLANFHASLVNKDDTMMDMTAGLGIDALHCANECKHILAIDINETTASTLRYNVDKAGFKNITVKHEDCRKTLADYTGDKIGTIFIDPARRSVDGGRVYSVSDCRPDVIELLPLLSEKCRRLIVKLSPMLDVSHTIGIMGGCSRVITLGNTNECKELIAIKDFDSQPDYTDPLIEAVTIGGDENISVFSYRKSEEQAADSLMYSSAQAGEYFYVPYPSLIKLSVTKLPAAKYGLNGINPNSRIYHSANIAEDFPGEIFKIERVIDFSSKNLKRFKSEYPAISVSTRNFGMSADELRHKLGVKDGGELRLFGISDCANQRKLLIANKIR